MTDIVSALYNMMLDFLKPLLYFAEKRVAGKSIPAVAQLANRQTLDTACLEGKTIDHSLWDDLLTKYVDTTGSAGDVKNNGLHAVDYEGLAKDEKFSQYLLQLEQADDPSELQGPHEMALWMNAYNALCVNLVVTHKPTKSINDLSKKGGESVWDQVAGKVAGKEVSLSFIEHDRLRAKWDEPAVHGCIVCASISCPNLRAEAYSGDLVKLKAQMKDQMVQWMANDTKGVELCGDNQNRLKLSRIFLWFEDDFGENRNEWISQYIQNDDIKTALGSSATRIRYFDYDWNLNQQQK